ncbi:MAG TPA: hypothetical protein VIL11_03835 [Limnochordales bacterium]
MSETSSLLQFLVKNSWVAENLHSLGPGRIYHLAYRTADMEPAVVSDLQRGVLGRSSPAQVAWLEPGGRPVPVADVELLEVHDFGAYFRFDFRIRTLYPYGQAVQPPQFLCRYVPAGPEAAPGTAAGAGPGPGGGS